MESPRGVGDASLGAFAQLLARVDCLVLVGKRLDFTLRFGAAFPAAAQVHQVDAEAAEIERSRRALGECLQRTAQADAGSALHRLTQAAQAAHTPSASGWRAKRAVRSTTVPPPGKAPPRSYRTACTRCRCCAGLPYALAARCARPEAPVVAVMGDGTVGFHIAEFDTAVRHGLHFVVVVGNDARWNAEYQIQLRDYGAERLIGCELRPTRYDTVAQAFGAYGEGVTEAAELPREVRRALDSALPACLNVRIEGCLHH